MDEIDFDSAFAGLTGHSPWLWQRRLWLDWFSRGQYPDACCLPAGLGKTSVIAIWLIALARHPDLVPRRLVYIVNRRTVVDQSTRVAESIRDRLPLVPAVSRALSRLCAVRPADPGRPLAISTLRGQYADNREWIADPSRPAVIAGTVDMIGSRLLFSGYGIGFRGRPLHAGCLGQDVLIVHDEAHLEPAYQHLICSIREEQMRCKDFRRMHVMELTATPRASSDAVVNLSVQDRADSVVRQRIEARKTIRLHENADEKRIAVEIADLALRHQYSGSAVLVYVRKVSDAARVASRLPKGACLQLTGTLRGLERDRLVSHPIYQRFLPESSRDPAVAPAAGTVYLICTSAGEVGVDLSGDHLVCDLSTWDSMVQRFGRVNRYGLRIDSCMDIVCPREMDEHRRRTLELLRQLGGNGSPAALGALDPDACIAAFAPPPTILPTSSILYDAWALTSIRGEMPGRPAVESYLHGISDDPPETYVAWRDEVGIMTGKLLHVYQPEDLLDDYPIKPHELLRDITTRVMSCVGKLSAPDWTPVWIVAEDNTVEVADLGTIRKGKKDRMEHKTLLLPPAAGGLGEHGMMTAGSSTANDVADEWYDGRGNRRRCRVWDNTAPPAGMRLIREIDTDPAADYSEVSGQKGDEAADQSASPRYWRWYERPPGADSEGATAHDLPVALPVHTGDVVRRIEGICAALKMPDDLQRVLRLAAQYHDEGKRRDLWQRSIGHQMPENPGPDDWIAKSGAEMELPGFRSGYRHEFGSLIDAHSGIEFQSLSVDDQDLVLHLIAAHHGRARPYFPPDESWDPEPGGKDVSTIAAEVPRRFARMQSKYGRWGLAYLESLLRAADQIASAEAREPGHEMEAAS